MFGPRSNDPIVQARSRENQIYIVFTHPAQFLVTSPDGSMPANTLLGDQLLIQPDEVGTAKDSNRVFYFDLSASEIANRRSSVIRFVQTIDNRQSLHRLL
jgi:hypothetical protein